MNNDNKPDLMADNNPIPGLNDDTNTNYEMPINPNEVKIVEEKKPEKKKKDENSGYTIGFIVLIVVLVSLFGLYIWSIFSGSDTNEEDTGNIVEVTNYTNNITYEEVGIMKKNKDTKSILFKITNSNTEMVSMTFAVSFYDENENLVDKVESKIDAIGVKKNYYINIDTSEEYSTYKTKMTAESVDNQYTDYTSEIEEKHTIKKNSGSIEIINNTGVTMEKVNTCVMYYSNSEFVGFSLNYISNLENEDSDIIKITIPTDPDTRNNITFDQYKMILFEAYAKK